MGSVCAEQHKFHPSHQLLLNKKTLREIDIPPRKLLDRRATAAAMSPETVEMFLDSPKVDETLLHKFLPYNGSDDDDADPYSSDHFRMFEFKVRRCTRSRSHDWTDCPFAHPGEKARRRDPRRYHYSGTVCSEFRRGSCSRGENCEFAHGVFECWLHPARYRTEACKDGKNCKRKVCFFAHTPRQLRILPSHCHDNSSPVNSPVAAVERKYRSSNHCCVFCHSVTASPTSTLMGMSHLSPPMSPSLSPPMSPAKTRSSRGYSPISRYADRLAGIDSCGLKLNQFNHGVLSYKDGLTELISSLDAMNMNHEAVTNNSTVSWVDGQTLNCDDQQQLIRSSSDPNPSGSRDSFSIGDSSSSSRKSFIDDNGSACPDFGWVNDLLQ
ncbi:zinc finger CCCH domain-containing protein 2 [Cornus florida]|uniref:zinc finger CCCH domain-containing protein 2 n=1 Tax=Cornus florida TaxID=4283 RepID=UPI00289E32AE|nr:zinc finger CCCH domain-containing protein 2 [Cornus florida]